MDQLLGDYLARKRSVFNYGQARGFPIEEMHSQRIFGPRIGGTCPPEGTEVFVSKLPRTMFEDDLIPYFEIAGKIYKFRLMVCVSELTNRGFAYVTYETKDAAILATQLLNNSEIIPGHFISVQKSKDNRRIFVGGIPDTKKKDEIWHELKRCGMAGIVDVIMYRSYTDRNRNRGFVFVEFRTHQEAALARHMFRDLILFDQRVQIDWSTPVHNVEPDIMKKVKKLFLRNLSVSQERDEFAKTIYTLLGLNTVVEKIYKHRDYAFIHFKTRRDAQRGMCILKDYYAHTDVEITWATPPPPREVKETPPPNYQISTNTFLCDFSRSSSTSPELLDRIRSPNALCPPLYNSPAKRDYVTLMDMINYFDITDS